MTVTKKHIGIDLDNTIICYDRCFYEVGFEIGMLPKNLESKKNTVKEFLTKQNNRQKDWEYLQGLVYGKCINRANLFEGSLEFIEAALASGNISISIVSHKTIFAHHDPERTNLRESAIRFLKKSGLISAERLSENQIYFCDSIDEKVDKISRLKCYTFIDDLEKIFLHPNFPKNCRPILFGNMSENSNSFSTWVDLKNEVLDKKSP